MKIQCTINEIKRDGYWHADPISNPEFQGNYSELKTKYSSGEITEIYAPELIDHIHWNSLKELMNDFSDLIRKNGALIIGGTDPYMLSKLLVARDITPETYNAIIFNRPANTKNMIPLPNAKAMVQAYGFKLADIQMDYSKCRYTVKGIKV